MTDQPGPLEAKLAELRDIVRERLPAFMDLVDQLAAELEESVVSKAVDVGEQAPDFDLPVAGSDRRVRLSEALARGPAVLCFYRGHW
ncbi:MAG TPA: hypothetical protein VMR52_05710 [Dehalococcoidia bacterium]|nr:hypothetical protein [Dehalococcoidia bacterium]